LDVPARLMGSQIEEEWRSVLHRAGCRGLGWRDYIYVSIVLRASARWSEARMATATTVSVGFFSE